MNSEIGGYFEFEEMTGNEYHSGLHRLNLGRTALEYLLCAIDCRIIYIPYYICDSVLDGARRAGDRLKSSAKGAAGIEIRQYRLNDDLSPQLDSISPENGEWVYITNFYGQLTEENIRNYRKKYTNIIVDNAQAFFDRPVEDIPTIYSCRKFLGVSDGAYVSANIDGVEQLPQDSSMDRFGYMIGRLETTASEHYSGMLAVNSTFKDMEPMQMSKSTLNVLKGIDYDRVIRKRRENYAALKKLLPSDNPFTVNDPFAPFAYPFYHPHGIELRKELASKKIYVQTNWKYLIDKMPESCPEHVWSADILPLPVDQRYGPDEMKYIAEVIKQFGD